MKKHVKHPFNLKFENVAGNKTVDEVFILKKN